MGRLKMLQSTVPIIRRLFSQETETHLKYHLLNETFKFLQEELYKNFLKAFISMHSDLI